MTYTENVEELLELTNQLKTQVEEKRSKIHTDFENDPENEIFSERKSRLEIHEEFIKTHIPLYTNWQEQLGNMKKKVSLLIMENIDKLKKQEQALSDKITSNYFNDKPEEIKLFFTQIFDLQIQMGIWTTIEEEFSRDVHLSYSLIESDTKDKNGKYKFDQEAYDIYNFLQEYDNDLVTIYHNYQNMAPVLKGHLVWYQEI